MKKLFIHHPLFRLLSPLFSGVLVYLLLLLINNNINQLSETFLSQELYVCIGLAYIIQEYSRLSILLFRRLKRPKSFLLRVILQIGISVLMTVVLVSTTMYFYFKYVLLFTPNSGELLIFNSIFIFITIIYVILYIAHYYLYKKNTEKLSKELAAKAAIDDDFKEFKKGINPELLFDSLEALLILNKIDSHKAENLTDNFASIYRYILTKKNNELVVIDQEIVALEELVALFNNLPYRKVNVTYNLSNTIAVVPSSLLQIIEAIIKTTVVSENKVLQIAMSEEDNSIKISYESEEKLRESFALNSIIEVVNSYKFYSNRLIEIIENEGLKSIVLPMLDVKENTI